MKKFIMRLVTFPIVSVLFLLLCSTVFTALIYWLFSGKMESTLDRLAGLFNRLSSDVTKATR